MQPTTNDNLTCHLLGHNLYTLELSNSKKQRAQCKCCGTKALIDSNGDIQIYEAIDKTFVNALRKLFVLKRSLI